MAGYFDIEPDELKAQVNAWKGTADKLQKAAFFFRDAENHCNHPTGPKDDASKANGERARVNLQAQYTHTIGLHDYLQDMITKTEKAHGWYVQQDDDTKGDLHSHGGHEDDSGRGPSNKPGGNWMTKGRHPQ
ncbi:MAG: hypothetical protein J2P17_08555 [Mycobacterium sp.]|nr:hypothetical protein [Mycobacterium sp.]